MPDGWELNELGSLAGDGTGDNDNDSQNDGDEYIAGTDPNNSSEFFSVSDVSYVGGLGGPSEFIVNWSTVLGRLYSLSATTNLSEPIIWTEIPGQTNRAGTGSTMSYTNFFPGTERYYLLEVEFDTP